MIVLMKTTVHDTDDEEPVEKQLTKKLLHQYDAAPLQPVVDSVKSECQ